ncbi:excalibur calcium-binding domain-containing protein [Dactylosporangium sp. CA-092794]|uniref:excalibur calcium-binding domain-containing protein n=1 Tax=Dactylosporangium sp. CA-092794 TaxID=3239929 RepID=UPI003D8C0DA9
MANQDNRPLFIVLGSVVGVLCLVICTCVGIGLANSPDKNDPEQRRDAPAVETRAPAAVSPSVVVTSAAPRATTAPPVVTDTEPPVATPPVVVPTTAEPPAEEATDDPGTDVYYKNCAEARSAGAAPLYRGDPGYRKALDRDGDGVACE